MKRLLLIEDDTDLAEMYAIGLRLHDFEVTHVASVAAAALEAARCSPEVAVIDISLPDGNGLDLLSAFGVDPGMPPLLAIIFSNFSDPDLITQAAQRGASAYLVKSDTSPAELVSILKQLSPS